MSNSICKRIISTLCLIVGITMVLVEAFHSKIEQDRENQLQFSNMPAWQRDSDEKITLDWYVNYSWFVTKWGDNLVSRTITDETGIDINFITPMGNETEKLNALIASDSLPDIITLCWWEPQVEKMIDQDMVYALNKLADQYDISFYQVADPNAVNWYTRQNGNIYCYPNSFYSLDDIKKNKNIGSNQTFLVRNDIYEALGWPDMSTPEGFESAVKEAVEKFPTVDGEPLIPIGAQMFDNRGCESFDRYLQNFLAVPYEKNGKAYDRFTDPEYIRWLKMFRRLGEEGYLANDIFVDQRTQMSEKLEAGRYFCMLYQRTDIADQEKILYQKNPDCIYVAVNGPANSNGDAPELTINDMNGWTVTLISKNCKHPDRAIELINYMISEHGQKLVYLGVEGVTYDMIDGKPVLKPEVKEILNTDREKYDRLYGADDAYWMLQNNTMQLKWKQKLDPPLKQLEEWTYPYTKYVGQYTTVMPEGSSVENSQIMIMELWNQTLPKLLLAESDQQFDEVLNKFIKKRNELGYADVVEEETRQIKMNKQRLGLGDI